MFLPIYLLLFLAIDRHIIIGSSRFIEATEFKSRILFRIVPQEGIWVIAFDYES